MSLNTTSDMSLFELFQRIWKARLLIAMGLGIGTLVAMIFLLVVTPTYKAEMIVAPADGYALGDYASSIQYDDIAALPFWRPKDAEGASTDFYRFIYTLKGAAVAEILLKDAAFLKAINKYETPNITTAESLSLYLQKHIRVDPLGATPLRRIVYNHPNAEFVAATLRKLHLVSDQMIRRDRRQQSQSRIDYLENALARTTNPEQRKGITNLLMQQEYVQMLANLDEAYAAIIVEPASASPKPTWPNKPIVFGLFCILGMLGGFVVWSLRQMRG